jgi:C4-type Zn-finger protein
VGDKTTGFIARSRDATPSSHAGDETVSGECPLCGKMMRIKTRELVDQIPGQSQVVRRVVREWTCPECDFYEEVEDDRAPG